MLLINKGPYLQMPEPDSIIVMWETSIDASSTVALYSTEKLHYGLNGNYKTIGEPVNFKNANENQRIHFVKLEGLKASTNYHYKVISGAGDERVESDIYPLKTAVQKNESFSFVVTSETGGFGDDNINVKLFNQIQRYRPDFLLFVGDIVREGKNYEDWDRYFFGPGKEMFVNTPFYVCLGNHERNSPLYYKFFGFPHPKSYYSFDYGNVHFTAIDSTAFVNFETYPLSNGEMSPGNPQYDFVVNDLKSSNAKWKIVFFHYPPFVSGDWQVDEMRKLCPVFEKYKVDVVFNSHTIVYERSHPIKGEKVDYKDGVLYIVAGGAGSCPHWFHHKREWHTAQALATPHFVQVIMSESEMVINAIDYEGHHFDSLKLQKKQVLDK